VSTGRYYYEILGLTPSATTAQVKKAYHALVRRNHPDLFADERKQLQDLKMVQINEAYTRILVDRFPLREVEPGRSGNGIRVKPRGGCDVGFHHDIEYAYYKQGFENYSRALHGIALMEKKARFETNGITCAGFQERFPISGRRIPISRGSLKRFLIRSGLTMRGSR
jgi:curved DNA-binding protein CbpA